VGDDEACPLRVRTDHSLRAGVRVVVLRECTGDSGSALGQTRKDAKQNLELTWTAPGSGSGQVSFSCYFVKSISENYYTELSPDGITLGIVKMQSDDTWDDAMTIILLVCLELFIEAAMMYRHRMFILTFIFWLGWTTFTGSSLGWWHFLSYRRISPPPAAWAKHIAARLISEDFLPATCELVVGQFMLILLFIGGCIAAIAAKASYQETLDVGAGAMRATGWAASVFSILLLLPTAHLNVWVLAFGMSFERSIKFHRIFGRVFIVLIYVHMIYVADFHGISMMVSTEPVGREPMYPLWGFLSAVFATMLGGLAIEPIRRLYFEVFYFSHRLLSLLVFVFAALHHLHVMSYLVLLLGALILYIADRILGMLRANKAIEVESAVFKGGTTVLQLKEIGWYSQGGLQNKAGDYCFIRVPQISKLQWHPFTISSAPKGKLSFHIKAMGEGTWSNQLGQLVQTRVAGPKEQQQDLSVELDGPYGSLQVDTNHYEVLVLLAGGIGVTPMAAILADILNHKTVIEDRLRIEREHQERSNLPGVAANDLFDSMKESMEDNEDLCSVQYEHLRHVVFIWAVRESETFELFSDLLDQASDTSFVELQLFVTRPETGQHSSKRKCGVGRPNLSSTFQDIRKEVDAASRRTQQRGYEEVATLVCGPDEMVEYAEREACKNEFHIHKESYYL